MFNIIYKKVVYHIKYDHVFYHYRFPRTANKILRFKMKCRMKKGELRLFKDSVKVFGIRRAIRIKTSYLRRNYVH